MIRSLSHAIITTYYLQAQENYEALFESFSTYLPLTGNFFGVQPKD